MNEAMGGSDPWWVWLRDPFHIVAWLWGGGLGFVAGLFVPTLWLEGHWWSAEHPVRQLVHALVGGAAGMLLGVTLVLLYDSWMGRGRTAPPERS